MMRVHQFAAQIAGQLGALQMLVQIGHVGAYDDTKFEFVFEQLWANLRDGLLEETGRTYDVNDVHDAREIILIEHEKQNQQRAMNLFACFVFQV